MNRNRAIKLLNGYRFMYLRSKNKQWGNEKGTCGDYLYTIGKGVPRDSHAYRYKIRKIFVNIKASGHELH